MVQEECVEFVRSGSDARRGDAEEKEEGEEVRDSAMSSSSSVSCYLDERKYYNIGGWEERECSRWRGYSELLPSLQLLDILQESTTLLRKHHSLLLALAMAVSVPLSAIVLSHVCLGLPFVQWLVRQVEEFHNNTTVVEDDRNNNPASAANRIALRRVTEILISNIVDIPFTAVFSPLLKAGVAYIVACSYGGKKPTVMEIWRLLQKLWLRLMQTFALSCSIFLAFAAAFAALLMYASRSGNTTTSSSFIVIVAGIAASAIAAISLCAGFAFMSVLCSLAYVVTVLEGLHGGEALVKSLYYLRGKLQVAMLLFLVTNVNGTLLDILFEFHIIASTDPSTDNLLSKLWEAPLLVFMHSFVYLFDAIMISVFYYICKSAGGCLESLDRCAHFNLDDVPNIISLSHVMSMGLNLHFYLLSQTWWEEKDEEGGASECGKQQ
ncbi:unnamed protein product [Sphagnum balticum]